MLPNLSQIRAWSTEHLIQAADYWTAVADEWENAFFTMRNDAHSLVWEGDGGDELRRRTRADVPIVSGAADRLRNAATVARTGAGGISAAQRRVLFAVEDAQHEQFDVAEDLTVFDTQSSKTAEDRAARQAQAEAFAGDIRLRAGQLLLAEHKVSGPLIATAGGVSKVRFAPASCGADVSAVPLNEMRDPTGTGEGGGGLEQFEGGPPGGAYSGAAGGAGTGRGGGGPTVPTEVGGRGSTPPPKLGAQPPAGEPSLPTVGPSQTNKVPLEADRPQIESKFKHAEDFGVTEPRGGPGFDNFAKAVKQVVDDPNTLHIQGNYRGQPAILNFNPGSGMCVIQSPDGKFLSGWKLSPAQVTNVLTKGSLGGGD